MWVYELLWFLFTFVVGGQRLQVSPVSASPQNVIGNPLRSERTVVLSQTAMKRNLILWFCVLTFSSNLSAQNPLVKQWDYRYGGNKDEFLWRLLGTTDGGFLIGGSSASDSSGDKTQPTWGLFDYWLVKTDSSGVKQWDKRFGGTSTEILSYIQPITDNGYILGGRSFSGIGGDKTQPSWGQYDYWILKIDSLGNKQWDKRYGAIGYEIFSSLIPTTDGGYLLTGYSDGGVSGDKTQANLDTVNTTYDFWLVKIDSLGIIQWDKVYGGTNDDILNAMIEDSDGGYVLAGSSSSPISYDVTQGNWDTITGTKDYWIIKIDSSGNKIWDKRYGGTSNDELFEIKKTLDGYILGGISISDSSGDKSQPSYGNRDYWIVKIDSLGNKQWDKDLGGSGIEDEFGNITLTDDAGYLIACTSYSPISGIKTESNLGQEQSWIIRLDSCGNVLWDKTIFTNGHDEYTQLLVVENGCYVIANQTNSGMGGYKTWDNWDTVLVIPSFDLWIIKFCDTMAVSGCNFVSGISNIVQQYQFSIYPNPTIATLNLFLNNKEDIVITNLVGEIVLQKTAKGKVELNVSFLASGIYFIKVGNEVRKFVKE